MAKPTLIILDEIDSGLDIDALKLVAHVINKMRTENPDTIVLIITHYQRILDYIITDRMHVLVDGKIVQSGDMQLVATLESRGYDGYLKSN